MFLALKFPGGDKHISLFAENLSGDEGYRAGGCLVDPDSDRARFDRAVRRCDNDMGDDAFGMRLFNQFCWQRCSGWEYWSRDYGKVLSHALAVAAELRLELHVHANAMDAVSGLTESFGIVDFAVAAPLPEPVHRELRWLNEELRNGEYFVLRRA